MGKAAIFKPYILDWDCINLSKTRFIIREINLNVPDAKISFIFRTNEDHFSAFLVPGGEFIHDIAEIVNRPLGIVPNPSLLTRAVICNTTHLGMQPLIQAPPLFVAPMQPYPEGAELRAEIRASTSYSLILFYVFLI